MKKRGEKQIIGVKKYKKKKRPKKTAMKLLNSIPQHGSEFVVFCRI